MARKTKNIQENINERNRLTYNEDTENLIYDIDLSGNDIQAKGNNDETPVENKEADYANILGEPVNILGEPKKCLILCMCCNDEYYQKEFDDIMRTWGGRIKNGAYPCLDIWAYTGSSDGDFKIDEDRHMIYVPAFDGLDHSFEKTVKCIEILGMSGFDYDWLLRTNCSTTINLQMLEKMMETDYLDKDKVYVAEPIINHFKSAPYKNMPAIRGNMIMMSKKFTAMMNMSCLEIASHECDFDRYVHKDMFKVDDLTISAIINTYALMRGYDVRDIYEMVPTQYMEDIYKDGTVDAYTLAIFNKPAYEARNIRNYYYDMHDRYMDFYKNYYDVLNDDINALSMAMSSMKYFICIEYDEATGESHILHIPYDQYIIEK